jgi:hypothetical protein
MPNPNSSSVFDRWFGPDAARQWSEWIEWEARRWTWHAQRHAEWAAWKAEHEIRRQAWRAERAARRAEWRAQRDADRWARHPFGAVWGFFWTLFWIGFGLLMIFSPEFRSGFIAFVLDVPKYAVRLLHALVGRAEI